MSIRVQQYAVGVRFEASFTRADGTAVDVSGASDLRVCFSKPDGTRADVVATYIASADQNLARAVTESGLLDQAGPWLAQAVAQWADGVALPAEPVGFEVVESLSDVVV